ncbi:MULTISPECIES: anti-sigma factor [Streptomyces]|uniref:Zf-HC2 domain-containing protein n=1 Tax=Streptomyces doudnae TaxID=3075536 RepID=A0ABD5EM93_9ACTN|nr:MULTISPECIES: zf-HC2 domain-containing protein [unclassified Streptomyces]MDT0435803.1 zf-HC2 domain-containing protein [Streptomyces sp. DSM 41981]MYQ62877.1 RNA polymerase subunit sigma [Streptomyces sp. SID4950]
MQESPGPNEHETVGAYALGILDDAEATAFEAHLAGCEWCAQQLDELAGMEPMLAALADLPGAGTPAIGESLSARPGPRLAEKLVVEVTEKRKARSRRSLFGLAASVILIAGGPLAVWAATGGSDDKGAVEAAAPPAQKLFSAMADKSTATDATTHVTATVATEEKAWGTHAVLQLGNVKGPLKCSLIAVGKNGERETVSTWSVPNWGYGIKNATRAEARNPLYVQGGAAFTPGEIDHFEVMTFTGKKLVQVDA